MFGHPNKTEKGNDLILVDVTEYLSNLVKVVPFYNPAKKIGENDMSDQKEIHEFAQKYYKLYTGEKTTERDVTKGFADLCFSLGFKMDCGKSFISTFSSEAFSDGKAFSDIAEAIDDVEHLGSAIFSHWRYVTHWDYGSSLLNEVNRPWFIAAFTRLSVITNEEVV